VGIRDRFRGHRSFGGEALPLAGKQSAPIELKRYGPAGPCQALVVVDAYMLESGLIRFRVTETWQPPQEGFGEISELAMYDTEGEALVHAVDAAAEWRAGSARSHRLAPDGRLRAPGISKRHTLDWQAIGPPELATPRDDV
jgi:hypothetical protein